MATATHEAFSLPLHPDHVGGIEGPWWAAWNADVQVLLPALFLAICYVRGRHRMERREPWWRTALFFSGIGVIVIALQSPVDRLGEHHFTFHMLQHEMLTSIGVPLLLLGAPTSPVLLGLPQLVRQRVVRPLVGDMLVRRAFSFLTHPLTAIAHLIVATVLWHLPSFFDTALRNPLVHDIQHTSFLVGGTFFWWNVIDPAPLHSRLAYPVRMLYLLPPMAIRVALSAFLTFSKRVWYPAYTEVAPLIPMTPLEDQQLGGLLMWVPGELLNVGVLAVLFFLWARRASAPDPIPVRTGLLDISYQSHPEVVAPRRPDGR